MQARVSLVGEIRDIVVDFEHLAPIAKDLIREGLYPVGGFLENSDYIVYCRFASASHWWTQCFSWGSLFSIRLDLPTSAVNQRTP